MDRRIDRQMRTLLCGYLNISCNNFHFFVAVYSYCMNCVLSCFFFFEILNIGNMYLLDSFLFRFVFFLSKTARSLYHLNIIVIPVLVNYPRLHHHRLAVVPGRPQQILKAYSNNNIPLQLIFIAAITMLAAVAAAAATTITSAAATATISTTTTTVHHHPSVRVARATMAITIIITITVTIAKFMLHHLPHHRHAVVFSITKICAMP